jgi:hypothetical protein
VLVGFTMQSRYFSRTVVKEPLVARSLSTVRLRCPTPGVAVPGPAGAVRPVTSEVDTVGGGVAVVAAGLCEAVASAVERAADRCVTDEVLVSGEDVAGAAPVVLSAVDVDAGCELPPV